MATDLVVTKRSGDFHIGVDGRPGLWSAGRSLNMALGCLLKDNRDFFRIRIIESHAKAEDSFNEDVKAEEKIVFVAILRDDEFCVSLHGHHETKTDENWPEALGACASRSQDYFGINIAFNAHDSLTLRWLAGD